MICFCFRNSLTLFINLSPDLYIKYPKTILYKL
nr:MAG TPA: hypothetical protein [Caudoviricetes sp.]